ncbi:MAG: hypothetical protein Q7T55_02435 [Solirubrobacteraceae bacterium]|nr:hypothetical protein [Solirubrobacteraceae bacterium]
MQRLATTTVALGLAATLIAAPGAAAKTSKCKAGKYLVGITMHPLKVEKLRAVNLPSKTDGYAPPCLVADAAASAIQDGSQGTLPSSITLMGARWNGGKWNCTYGAIAETNAQRATCRKAGHASRKITMELSAR